jgi:hypothetical protein
MGRSHAALLFAEAKISRREMRRSRGLPPDEIDDPAFQKGDDLGTGAPGEWGPADAGRIDSKANRRSFPRESVPGQQKLPGNKQPSDAQVRRVSSQEWWPARWYGDPPRRQE